MQKEFIVCAAVHYNDGKTYKNQPKNILTGFVISGRRHGDCYATAKVFAQISDKVKEYISTFEAMTIQAQREMQGFITSKNRYVGRKEAWVIAKEYGQIKFGLAVSDIGAESELISENLYDDDTN